MINNETYNVRYLIPSHTAEIIRKAYEKMQKYVQGVSMTIGKEQRKVFCHAVVVDGLVVGHEKRWHLIREVEITLPTIKEWWLKASYEDGLLFVSDPTKELEFSNKEHGFDYNKCDMCGHYIKNSYVVENKTTGEELQVGCECLKKFGLDNFKYIHKFTRELYDAACYIGSVDIDDAEKELHMWRGYDDKYAFSVCERLDLLRAAYKYYSERKEWRRGKSSDDIQAMLSNREFAGDDDWLNNACEYALKQDAMTEFSMEMQRVAKNYYAMPSDAPYAFFIIKNYDDYLRAKELPVLKVGVQVKVEDAEVVNVERIEDYYGSYDKNTLMTKRNYKMIRKGKIPMTRRNNKAYTSFYALIGYIDKYNNIYLERATKNPKKGYITMEV